MKLDQKFYGTVVKAKDGSIVPADEYVVFLAKDNAFAATLPTYLENCTKMGADQEQLAAVQRLIRNVDLWRQDHPDKCKVPDTAGKKTL